MNRPVPIGPDGFCVTLQNSPIRPGVETTKLSFLTVGYDREGKNPHSFPAAARRICSSLPAYSSPEARRRKPRWPADNRALHASCRPALQPSLTLSSPSILRSRRPAGHSTPPCPTLHKEARPTTWHCGKWSVSIRSMLQWSIQCSD